MNGEEDDSKKSPNEVERSSTTKDTSETPPIKKQRASTENTNDSDSPVYEVVGGSTLRRYLNKNLTQHLLDGVREVSKEKPEDPVRWLGNFLIERSNQLSRELGTDNSPRP